MYEEEAPGLLGDSVILCNPVLLRQELSRQPENEC